MQAWWQERARLRRFTADLVACELAQLRRTAVTARFGDDLRLDADLGVDSLELLQLGTAFAEALQLHESGIEDYLLARRTIGDWLDVAAAGLERFSERLIFRTSGSTGSPKPCQHSLAGLQQEATHLAEVFADRRRVLCAVPCHHIYGFLFGVLLPAHLRLGEQQFVDVRGSSPAWLVRGAQPGDVVIAHPEFWAAAARAVPRWPDDVVGVTSTAPCAPDVARAVGEAGLQLLVQVYGSSETAGIAMRADPDAPYELLPFWRFDPANPQWLLRAMPEGGEQAFAPQDALQRVDERRFHVGSRFDQAVQVGGVNVFPQRVREVLRRHPGVRDAAVRLMHPDEGSRLKAFVVPAPGAAAEPQLLADLHAWVDRELAAPERPKAIRLGAALPTSANGKPADWSLAAQP